MTIPLLPKLQMTNNDIKGTERQVAVFMLRVLCSVINELVKTKQLERWVGDYIYDACKDMAVKQGFISE